MKKHSAINVLDVELGTFVTNCENQERISLNVLKGNRFQLPPAKHDFNNSVSLNDFASKAATSAVILEYSSKDLQIIFLTVLFTASVS